VSRPQEMVDPGIQNFCSCCADLKTCRWLSFATLPGCSHSRLVLLRCLHTWPPTLPDICPQSLDSSCPASPHHPQPAINATYQPSARPPSIMGFAVDSYTKEQVPVVPVTLFPTPPSVLLPPIHHMVPPGALQQRERCHFHPSPFSMCAGYVLLYFPLSVMQTQNNRQKAFSRPVPRPRPRPA
jgi:hypothetical protein